MPEGDVVYRAADRLRRALLGERLTVVDLRWGDLDESVLREGVVTAVVPRGKHLLHRVERDGAAWTLHTHLRMEGSWRIEPAGGEQAARALRRPDLRVALGSDRWLTLGLRLGLVELLPTADEARVVGHLGPDVLGDDWDPEVAAARILASPAATIAEALLDQRNLAGVGTFWASEALFLEGLHPWATVAQVAAEPAAVPALLARISRLMARGIHEVVHSTTGLSAPGEESYVHARSGRPCRRCGDLIRVAPLGAPPKDRVFFSCPTCQGGRAPTDDGRAQAPLSARRNRSARRGGGGRAR